MAKLRPRARIIRTIGDQLISGPEAALIELVKNAYDADSKDFYIKVVPPSEECPLGAIFLQDHGHGMTFDDVIGRWFEPATDEKLKRSTSPGGRRMLGAKGIGRFAASRLGSKTILKSISFTDPKKAGEEILVQIDWNDFGAEKYLDDIEIPIRRRRVRSSASSGIGLVVTDLRDIWSKKRLENLIRELRRVSAPKEGGDSFEIRLDLSEFSIKSSGFDGSALISESTLDASLDANGDETVHDPTLIIPFRLQDHSDYRVTGKFDASGKFTGSFAVSKGDNLLQPLSVDAPPLDSDESACGIIFLDVNVYDREAESVEDLFQRMNLDFNKIGIRAARQILTDNSGIAIFRSGFRIRPYGEPENDWLELERMRVQDPSRKLGLSQVSGRVLIESETSSGLIERSSREGLEHNGEFQRLKTLIRTVLIHVEQRRLAFREKAGLSRKRSADVAQVRELASLQTVSNAVSRLPPQYQDKVRKAIAKDMNAITASLEEIDEYQKLLQSRASLGLVVAQIIHEGRRILNPMSTAAKVIYDHRDWVSEVSKRGDVYRNQFSGQSLILKNGARDMSKLFKRLDPVSGRRRGKPVDFQLSEIIDSSISLFTDSISSNSIIIDLGIPKGITAFGYVEDIQAALLNILENAIHWLSVAEQPVKKISISVSEIDSEVRVSVMNNAPPIDESYVSRLFQPGFSLKSAGTGLGLSIAREACRASKGDLLFVDRSAETCFVIIFPKSS